MKKILFFFPYALTNVGTLLFVAIGCCLFKDAYRYTFLTSIIPLFLTLLTALLLLSAPRYLIKGVVPESFKITPQKGFLSIGKYLVLTTCFYYFFIFNRDPSDLSFWYKGALLMTFCIAIYCHFFWGSARKNRSQDSSTR